MPTTWNPVTLDQLDLIAIQLKRSFEKLVTVMDEMVKHGMKDTKAPWTPTHSRHLGAITSFAEDALKEIGNEVLAKKFGHESRVDVEKKKAQKTTARRKATKKKP